jgi:hypothetical protein
VDHRQGVALSPEALAVMQQILGGRLGEALNQGVGPVSFEVDHLATQAMEHHLERRLRSVRLLDRA